MSLQSVGDLSFDFLPSRPVEVEISDSPLSSDAGLLPIRQLDERLRFASPTTTQGLAPLPTERPKLSGAALDVPVVFAIQLAMINQLQE